MTCSLHDPGPVCMTPPIDKHTSANLKKLMALRR